MTTTILEPLAVITDDVGGEVSSVFGLNTVPMFLPGGGLNP